MTTLGIRALRLGGLLLLMVCVVQAQATMLAPNPDLTVEGKGLTIVAEGVGLEDLDGGTANITIDIGGPVQKAFFYWVGRDAGCPTNGAGECVIPFEPYLDQELLFDGTPIEGVIVGTEGQAPSQETNNIGYRADVTAVVQAKGPGTQSFTIADDNLALNFSRFNGGGLVVLYTDESDPNYWEITVFEGLDFAFDRADQEPAARVTEPVVFTYEPEDVARVAELVIFAGDATRDRPDRIDISDNASLVNELTGADGDSFDALKTNVDVPSGTAMTVVQLFSAPPEQNPDSLLWELGSLRVPFIPEEDLCRVTGGGVDETGNWDGSQASGKCGQKNAVNRYTFGGQAGAPTAIPPQPYGEWTHHQQRGPDGSFVFHAGTASAPPGTEIDIITCSDPENCEPARNAPFKQIDFAGVGTFKNMRDPSSPLMGVVVGETFHWFDVHIEDLGEPGRGRVRAPEDICPPGGSEGTLADCECPDFYRITIYKEFDPDTEAPNKTDVIYEVYGYIDGGNLQIHPPID